MNNRRHSIAIFAAFHLCPIAIGGCAVERSHELGDAPSERANDFARDETPSEQPVAQLMSEFDGLWVGEAEDPLSRSVEPTPYAFPSGSTRILLDLHWGDPEASHIIFGEGPEVPPPTDPNAMYPEGGEEYVQAGVYLEPLEGHAYHAYYTGPTLNDLYRFAPGVIGTLDEVDLLQRMEAEGQLIDGRLNIMYAPLDLFRPWCDLQPPERSCAPDTENAAWQFADDDGNCFDPGGVPVDCGVIQVCNYICREINADLAASLLLQLTVDGLVGVFNRDAPFRNDRGFLSPLGTVRFRRAGSEE